MEQAVGAGLGGIVGLLILAVLGLAIGTLAKMVTPGPDPGGWFATILLGILGSWLGGFLASQVGLGTGFVSGLIFAVIGAVVLLLLYKMVTRTAGSQRRCARAAGRGAHRRACVSAEALGSVQRGSQGATRACSP
jgi:uncharacterized membrane protein YeaQ/YmgE (transglycosylase-associated protein family)